MSNHHLKQATHTLPEFSLDIPIFTKLYDFYQKLSFYVIKFPKTKRYTLGQKLDNLTLEIFELLFSIPIAENKTYTLQQISIKLDLLKILTRLSKDSQSLKDKNYLELQSLLQEIGRMLGGWLKSTKQNTP